MTADKLDKKLGELFEDWKEESEFKDEYLLNHFFKDGPFDTKRYLSGEYKILFLLKETNGDRFDSVKKFYDTCLYENSGCYEKPNGKYYNMWYKLREWTEGILTCEQHNPYDKILKENISRKNDEDDRLRKVAVLNVKKYFGGASSDKKELEDYAEADKEFIKREIRLLDPDIIVCGGTWSLLDIITQKSNADKTDYIAATLERLTEEDGGVLTFEGVDKLIMVIDMYHPAWFGKNNKILYDIITDKYKKLKSELIK